MTEIICPLCKSKRVIGKKDDDPSVEVIKAWETAFSDLKKENDRLKEDMKTLKEQNKKLTEKVSEQANLVAGDEINRELLDQVKIQRELILSFHKNARDLKTIDYSIQTVNGFISNLDMSKTIKERCKIKNFEAVFKNIQKNTKEIHETFKHQHDNIKAIETIMLEQAKEYKDQRQRIERLEDMTALLCDLVKQQDQKPEDAPDSIGTNTPNTFLFWPFKW